MKFIFFLIPLLLISTILISSAYADGVIKEKNAKHITPDNTKRIKQVFAISEVEKGSSIIDTNVIFSLDDHIGYECFLVLDEPGLNPDIVSESFTCAATNNVNLSLKGKHALQTKLNDEKFRLKIKTFWDEEVNARSNEINLDVTYKTPSYFAKIENNIVTNIIVADQDFISSLSGNWVETYKNNLAGIGYTYSNGIFIPLAPYQSWIFDGVKWKSPVIHPNDGSSYSWNETNKTWDLVN